MTTAEGTLTEKYRRNGKLQSCETCRKSKLRCDHVVPACGRCVRRGKASTCFYHPNPLTQQRRQTPTYSIPTPKSASESTSSLVSPRDAVLHSIEGFSDNDREFSASSAITPRPPRSPLSFITGPNQGAAEIHVLCQPFHRAASAPPLDYQRLPEARRNTGFQGMTSHYTILNEGLHILEPDPMDVEAMGSDHEDIVITNSRINQGCKLLAFFKNQQLINWLLTRRNEACDGGEIIVIWPILKEWIYQIWMFHSDALLSQDPVKIRKLSERIWRNTLTPLNFDGKTTAQQWAQLGTGWNLRWEVIGLIALNLGFGVIEAPATAQIFAENKVSRACLIGQLKEIADKCLVFCRYCETLDDLFVWLLLEHSITVSALKGDRHYATYRATGEAHSAVIAMGLHQAIKTNDKVPFFLAELRKRAFLVAYFGEISLATLLGRPPRLSYRYCTISTPLDLTESQLVQTGDALEATLSSLDDQGFNTAGLMQRNTAVRTCLHSTMRREDIIDLALGQHTRDEILARAAAIEAQNERHLAALPPFVRELYTSGSLDLTNSTQYKPIQAMQIGSMRTGSRSNEIMLQRVLIRKTGANSKRLTAAARAVVRDVLQITARHDIASHFQASYNMYLSSHGLRSAAILAIELLKQEMLPEYPAEPLLPRSQTIQDLAIFAARLAAVDPSDGTASLCVLGNRVISKILDRILSPGGARQQDGAPVAKACEHEHQANSVPPSSTANVQSSTMQSLGEQDEETQQAPPGLVHQQSGQMDGEGIMPPPLNAMMMMSLPSDMSGYGMMDVGIGIDAPMSLGQDTDFMRWMEGMNWERTDNWSI